MQKVILVWLQTYRRSVWHPAFLTMTFGLPFFLALVGGVAAYFVLKATEGDRRPVGIVDSANVLVAPERWQPANSFARLVELRSFAGDLEAERALQAGEIQAYYVVAPDYVSSGVATEVAAAEVGARVRSQVRAYLTEGLLKATEAERRARLAQGTTIRHRSLTDQREMTIQLAVQAGVVGFVLMAFYFINTSSTSDMLQALREEKEKKTIEISLSSLTVEQLLIGKVGGIVSVGVSQFAVWFGGAALVAVIAWPLLESSGVRLVFEPLFNLLWLCLGLLLPTYITSATSVVVISSLSNLAGRGEQVVSLILNLVSVLLGPLALIALSSPDNPISVALSMLPISAPLLVIRALQVIVPTWQIVLAFSIVWGAMVLNLFFAARIYRASWLMAGQRNWLRGLWWALSGK
jgi:ABC-2 type transport system permease protein